MTIRIRVEIPADAPATRRVHMAAFPGPEEADLVDALRRDAAWVPALSVVAVDERDLIVGHVLLTRLQVGDGDGLSLAPVAVAPEWQRKGVGTALVQAALAAAEAAGSAWWWCSATPATTAGSASNPPRAIGSAGPSRCPTSTSRSCR